MWDKWQWFVDCVYRFLWLNISRVFCRPAIFAIGDSHTLLYRRTRPFLVYWLGPITAHNLKKPNSRTMSRRQLLKALQDVNKQRDVVLLVAGEIDCRIHLYNQFKKQGEVQSLDALMDATIHSYGLVLSDLREQGYTVVVHSIPPAGVHENGYGYEHYAPLEVRIEINKKFNSRLRLFCHQQKYNYLDLFSPVSDPTGRCLEKYKGDGIHLRQTAIPLVREWFVNKFGSRFFG